MALNLVPVKQLRETARVRNLFLAIFFSQFFTENDNWRQLLYSLFWSSLFDVIEGIGL